MITCLHQESHWRSSLLKLVLDPNLILLLHCNNLAKIPNSLKLVDHNFGRSPFKCFRKWKASAGVLLQHLSVR